MPVYLDNNATTTMPEVVVEAMLPYLTQPIGNPSSVHRYGRLAKDAIEQARLQVANLVNVQASQIIFTSGGTEANNLALIGTARNCKTGHIAISAVEHPSVIEPALSLKAAGWQVDIIDVDQSGRVTTDYFSAALAGETKLASVMMANNESGVIQPIEQLAKIAKDKDIIFHSDVSQAVAKMEVDFQQLQASLLTLSSHKMYGPRGAGALVVDKSLQIQPLIYGGGQEKNLRSGTENIAAIVGFGKAAELAKENLAERTNAMLGLRIRLESGLKLIPSVTIFAEQADRLPNTVLFAVEGIEGDALLMLLDKKGFAVSSGSACHSSKTEPSHVLKAMGVNDSLGAGAIRVSLGIDNTQQDIETFLAALNEILKTLRPNLSFSVN